MSLLFNMLSRLVITFLQGVSFNFKAAITICSDSGAQKNKVSHCFPIYLPRSDHVQMWKLDHKEGSALKNWCFKIVLLEKTLESFLDCKKIKPVNHKGNQPWIVTEGLMLKLKLQYPGHLMQRADSLEKTLMLGKTEGKRRRGWQRMRWLDSITNAINMNLSKFFKIVKDRGA